MRKTMVVCALCALIINLAGAVFAGGRNLNGNQSAEFCKTLNRFASTDSDATFFNPAGTALMADGLYLYVSNQFVYQPIEIKTRGGDFNVLAGVSRLGTYKGEKHAWLFPDFFLVHKKDAFAFSLGLYAIGGGGDGIFNEGLQDIDAQLGSSMLSTRDVINGLYQAVLGPTVNIIGSSGFAKSKFTGSTAVYTAQANFSYAVIKDKLSLALGVRFFYGDQKYRAKLWGAPGGATYGGYIPLGTDFNTHQQGASYGFVVGISAKPVDSLTIGIKGEWSAPLRLNAQSHNDMITGFVNSGFKDQGKTHMQQPANVTLGIAYRINGLQIQPSFGAYFNQFAQLKGKEKGYTTGYDVGIGFDYTFSQVPLNIGWGYLYSPTGARPSAQSQMDEDLDMHNVSLGFTVKFSEVVSLTLAELYTRYVPININKGSTSGVRFIPAKFYKNSFDTAIGLTFKAI